ncbi:MAG: 7-carboxy-7-deazaguanine synthase [Rhodomicrobium sp.]|nr:7-carboxy-7-deazaguanine synthase [Rhodomicrobium sp.]
MRIYSVKEIFYTLQGEGAQSGRAAVFLRFAGCNLWTGREADRPGAVCRFCDTDFVGVDGPGGGKFEGADALADAVAAHWPSQLSHVSGAKPYVVCTGGEPLLQLDAPLIEALHARGFEIAIETNGTIAAPAGIDWICVSPKGRAPLVQLEGDELKFVYPQEDAEPIDFEALPFRHFFIQPMDGPRLHDNVAASAAYCLAHPRWRLSLQMHKLAGIP